MRNTNISILIPGITITQRRFYILLATLILSNFAIKPGYSLSGYCDTDTTRTCYTCNPYEMGTNQYERHLDIIAGQCSDHNDAEVWCKTYQRHGNGDIIPYNNEYYECTIGGWQISDDYAPGSDGGNDTPLSCNAGYYAKTQYGPCVKCPDANFDWAEYEDGEYFPLEKVEGTSNGGVSDIYSCYIESDGRYSKNLYMNDTGMFTLARDCYYGS